MSRWPRNETSVHLRGFLGSLDPAQAESKC